MKVKKTNITILRILFRPLDVIQRRVVAKRPTTKVLGVRDRQG